MMIELARGLIGQAHHITVIVVEPFDKNSPRFSPPLPMVTFKRRRVIHAFFPLLRFFFSTGADIVISSLPHLNSLCALIKKITRSATKLVLVEHNTLSKSLEVAHSWRGKYLHLPMRLTYPFADAVVSVSKGVRVDLLSTLNLDPKLISVIYNPVVTQQLLSQHPKKKHELWPGLGQAQVILGIGRLTKAKNFDLLIRAFARTRESFPVKLLILGEGPERGRLSELITKLGVGDDCRLLGFVDDPYSYMKAADIFALSSLWEGLPTVLIEALACNMKIVSTDCKSGPREILLDGSLGILVPVDNESEFHRALLDACSRPTPRHATSSWLRYSTDTAVAEYSKLLTALFDNRSKLHRSLSKPPR